MVINITNTVATTVTSATLAVWMGVTNIGDYDMTKMNKYEVVDLALQQELDRKENGSNSSSAYSKKLANLSKDRYLRDMRSKSKVTQEAVAKVAPKVVKAVDAEKEVTNSVGSYTNPNRAMMADVLYDGKSPESSQRLDSLLGDLVLPLQEGYYVSTRKVAKVFSRRHKLVLRIFNKSFDNPDLANSVVKGSFRDVRNVERPMYFLDRAAVIYMILNFRGDNAFAFKESLHRVLLRELAT